MADHIRFDYEKMAATAATIREIAGKYKVAAETFQTNFTTAVASWEGESKDKLQKYITVSVKEYTQDSIPALLTALAELLEGNAAQMKQADHQIADTIPSVQTQQVQ
jgi:uncharacterized protein YukE